MGLTVIDLSGDDDMTVIATRHILRFAASYPDGNTAREILGHPIRHVMPHHMSRDLIAVQTSSAPGTLSRDELGARLLQALGERHSGTAQHRRVI